MCPAPTTFLFKLLDYVEPLPNTIIQSDLIIIMSVEEGKHILYVNTTYLPTAEKYYREQYYVHCEWQSVFTFFFYNYITDNGCHYHRHLLYLVEEAVDEVSW